MNLVLSNVVETVYTIRDTVVETSTNTFAMLFVRGDSVILASVPDKK